MGKRKGEMADFQWSDLKGKEVLGGRKGGMPEMVFEYILKENGLDPAKDLSIDQSIDFGSTAAKENSRRRSGAHPISTDNKKKKISRRRAFALLVTIL